MPDAAALEHYKQGLSLYGEGKYTLAIGEYEKALAIDPEWSDALQAKGMAQMHSGKLEDALKTLKPVTEMAPEDPLAFTSLSMAYVRLENIEEAEKAQAQARLLSWKQELKTNPDAPPPDGGMPVQQ